VQKYFGTIIAWPRRAVPQFRYACKKNNFGSPIASSANKFILVPYSSEGTAMQNLVKADQTLEFETIRKALEQHICIVDFVKKNGEPRTLFATLSNEVIDHFGPVVPNKRVVPVWSMEDNAWRSFSLDSVLEFRTYCYPGDY
jgi:hypothetical protein